MPIAICSTFLTHFSRLFEENLDHKVSIEVIYKFEMSFYNMYGNIPEASVLEIFDTLLPTEYEKECDSEAAEIESDGSEELATFTLDEEYLKKIIDELYTEDTSETDSISTDDDGDLISES